MSGSKDAKGEQVRLLRETLDKMACKQTCELHVVVGGKHNPFESTPKKHNQVFIELYRCHPSFWMLVRHVVCWVLYLPRTGKK